MAHALLRAASPLMAMHGGRDESRGAKVESAIPGTQECVRRGCRCIVILARTLSSMQTAVDWFSKIESGRGLVKKEVDGRRSYMTKLSLWQRQLEFTAAGTSGSK